MPKDQTVSEMAKEVLARQAEALVGRTGQPFESALEAVAGTDARRGGGRLFTLLYIETPSNPRVNWKSVLPAS